MPLCNWIICERTNRWAAALRLAVERDAATLGASYRLREVRILGELTSALVRSPASLVALEVHDRNLSDVLAWLSAAERRFPQARCVALVDRALSADHQRVPPGGQESLRDVCDALREAGAWDVAQSPRRLQPMLELARRHAIATAADVTILAEHVSFTEHVWATLPWQGA